MKKTRSRKSRDTVPLRFNETALLKKEIMSNFLHSFESFLHLGTVLSSVISGLVESKNLQFLFDEMTCQL
jgi:hypothetical protein